MLRTGCAHERAGAHHEADYTIATNGDGIADSTFVQHTCGSGVSVIGVVGDSHVPYCRTNVGPRKPDRIAVCYCICCEPCHRTRVGRGDNHLGPFSVKAIVCGGEFNFVKARCSVTVGDVAREVANLDPIRIERDSPRSRN